MGPFFVSKLLRKKNMLFYEERGKIGTFSFTFQQRVRKENKMLENEYQLRLKKRIKNLLPGCIVLKNDPNIIQGIPDLLVLHGSKWAALEVKKSENETRQPNQDYYVDKMNTMSFASFIYPENEEVVLDALQRSFES